MFFFENFNSYSKFQTVTFCRYKQFTFKCQFYFISTKNLLWNMLNIFLFNVINDNITIFFHTKHEKKIECEWNVSRRQQQNTRPVHFQNSGFATEFFTHLIKTWYRYLEEHKHMDIIWIGYENLIKKKKLLKYHENCIPKYISSWKSIIYKQTKRQLNTLLFWEIFWEWVHLGCVSGF